MMLIVTISILIYVPPNDRVYSTCISADDSGVHIFFKRFQET